MSTLSVPLIILTRDVEKAKQWLKDRTRGNERYGIIVSSQAYRLRPLAIDVRVKPDPIHWFLADRSDIRSSYQLEDVVLLTRARQGMIIVVPEGNLNDPTRLPQFYDSTYNYLKSLGLQLL